MHARRVAARHDDGIAGDGFARDHLAVGADDTQLQARDPQLTGDAQGGGTGEDPQTRCFRRQDTRTVHAARRTGIRDHRDGGARSTEVQRCFEGRITTGQYGNALADANAIAVRIGARGRCQHHTRAIVAWENQWTFDTARRQHDLGRPNLPQPLSRQMARR